MKLRITVDKKSIKPNKIDLTNDDTLSGNDNDNYGCCCNSNAYFRWTTIGLKYYFITFNKNFDEIYIDAPYLSDIFEELKDKNLLNKKSIEKQKTPIDFKYFTKNSIKEITKNNVDLNKYNFNGCYGLFIKKLKWDEIIKIEKVVNINRGNFKRLYKIEYI